MNRFFWIPLLGLIIAMSILMVSCFHPATYFETTKMSLGTGLNQLGGDSSSAASDNHITWVYARTKSYHDEFQLKEIETYDFYPSADGVTGTFEYRKRKARRDGYRLYTYSGTYEEDYANHLITFVQTQATFEESEEGKITQEDIDPLDLEKQTTSVIYDASRLVFQPFCKIMEDGSPPNHVYISEELASGNIDVDGAIVGKWQSTDLRYEYFEQPHPETGENFWISDENIIVLEANYDQGWFLYYTTDISHSYEIPDKVTSYKCQVMDNQIPNASDDCQSLINKYYTKIDDPEREKPPKFYYELTTDEADISQPDKANLQICLDSLCDEIFIEEPINATMTICVTRSQSVVYNPDEKELWSYGGAEMKLNNNTDQLGWVLIRDAFYFPGNMKVFRPFKESFDEIVEEYAPED